MDFMIKDLVLSLNPRLDLGRYASCGACTSDSSGPPCSGICPGSKDPMPALYEGIRAERSPALLAVLKEQLLAHLAAVDERATALQNERQFSEADKEMLREQLTGALRALDSPTAE